MPYRNGRKHGKYSKQMGESRGSSGGGGNRKAGKAKDHGQRDASSGQARHVYNVRKP